MSRPRRLEPGPERKTPAWRLASFLMGIAALLLALELIGLLDLGGRLLFMLVLGGLAISGPYGVAWGQGRAPAPVPEPGPIPTEVRGGERGATYVIVNTDHRRRRLRPKELSPGWYALYTIFWRTPVAIGDYVLTGVWRVVHRIWGFNETPRLGELPRPQADLDRETPPDRDLF